MQNKININVPVFSMFEMASKDIEKYLIKKAWKMRRTGEFLDLDEAEKIILGGSKRRKKGLKSK